MKDEKGRPMTYPGGKRQADERKVTREWLDDQDWIVASEDSNDSFRRYVFGNMQIWWHAALDHCQEWSTIYVGRESVASNPTVYQCEIFRDAMRSVKSRPVAKVDCEFQKKTDKDFWEEFEDEK